MFRTMRRIKDQMDETKTLDLLKKGEVGVLGTIGANGYPYTIPLNYVVYNNKIYAHCAKDGHKIDNIINNGKISFSVYDHVEIIGEELNTRYQSVSVFGKAKVLDATHDVLYELIKKYSNIPKEQATRMIDKEIEVTSMIEIEIEHITGKEGK